MQKLVSLAVLGFLTALLAAPGAAAQEDEPGFQDIQEQVQSVGDIEITVGSKLLTVSWQGIEVGANLSSWLREKLDGIDGTAPDGDITPDEADSGKLLIESMIQSEFNQYADDERLSGYLVIDHANPGAAKVESLVVDGITGPVASEDGISLSFVVAVAFNTQNADVHTVKLDMGRYYFKAVNESKAEELVGDFSLTIKAGSGWAIDAASLQPECTADNLVDGALVFSVDDINCFTDRTGVILGFAITGHDDESFLPGFELAGLVAGLVAAVLVRRRH